MPINERGRDFVFGGFDGGARRVEEVMQQVGFDPAVDRLFGFGDCLASGPDAWRNAHLMDLPYIFCVRGPRDEALLGLYEMCQPDQQTLRALMPIMGTVWWEWVDPSLRREILAAAKRLPLALEVQTRRGTVGIVHGGVPPGMGWSQFLLGLEQDSPRVCDEALEGRLRRAPSEHASVLGAGRVFVRHASRSAAPTCQGNVYQVGADAVLNLLLPRGAFGSAGAIAEEEEGRPFGLYARGQGGPVA